MNNTYFSALPCWAQHRVSALVLLLVTAGVAQAQTTTYSYTAPGGNQTYTVPAGVTAIRVVATGASGGATIGGSTGFPSPSYGAQVQATVLVTPGETLTVVVGGQGGSGSSGVNAGGFNGGGAGKYQGGGGGATDLRRSGGSTGDYLTSRNALVVAGGAGGNYTINGLGGNGGTPIGGNGAPFPGSAGGGATQTGPGTAGNGIPGGTATPGNNGTGGAGSTYTGSSGSGGGGGYYGGGGSYTVAGGGGGSSWVMPTSSSITYGVATTTGDGVLTITPTSRPLANVSMALGQQVSLYPIPATTGIQLTLSASLGHQAVQATLLNAAGRQVRAFTLAAQGTAAHSLDLQGLTAGFYTLRLSTSAGLVVKKILVE